MDQGNLFIVARHDVQLYEFLKQEFAGEPVTVLLDRRRGEATQHGGPPGGGLPEVDRRGHGDVDETLRTRGFVVVRQPRP